jgi:hypothetical protein
VHPALEHIELADVLEIACPGDRDEGGDVVAGRGAHPVAGRQIASHPVMVAS